MKKPDIFFFDAETKSLLNIKEVNTETYCHHPSTSFIIPGIRHNGKYYNLDKDKSILKKIKKDSIMVAHNWRFDFYLFNRFYPGVCPPPEQWECTLATAYRNGLPGKLDVVANILSLKNRKEKDEGQKLINRYSKPKKDGTFREIPEEDYEKFEHYNDVDLIVTEELYNFLPRLKDDTYEYKMFELDKKINMRGFKVDSKRVRLLKVAYEKQLEKVEKLAAKLGVEESGTLTINSPKAFVRWLQERGVDVDNAQAATLDELRRDKTIKNKEVIKALEYREFTASAAVKKLYAFERYVNDDDVSTGSLAYYKARTGRFAGRDIQPQNIMRDTPDQVIDKLTKLKKLEAKGYKPGDYDGAFDLYLKNPQHIELLGSLMRGLITPRKGNRFVIGDLTQIEARTVFWVSDCENILQILREKRDVYKIFAGLIYSLPEKEISKQQRAVGKEAVLALGYGMGALKFQARLAEFGIELSLAKCKEIVALYRQTFFQVTILWKKMEAAFVECMQAKPGTKITEVGVRLGFDGPKVIMPLPKGMYFQRTGRSLRIYLPSGRYLNYYRPGFRPLYDPKLEAMKPSLSYQPEASVIHIWGGKIVENVIQAIARDILMESALEIDKKYGIVLTIHDEIISETPAKQAKKALHDFEVLMSTNPTWAEGLPLNAECFIADRYGKG